MLCDGIASDADCCTVRGVTVRVVLIRLFLHVVATVKRSHGRVRTGFGAGHPRCLAVHQALC